jgi:hypothetical protein
MGMKTAKGSLRLWSRLLCLLSCRSLTFGIRLMKAKMLPFGGVFHLDIMSLFPRRRAAARHLSLRACGLARKLNI